MNYQITIVNIENGLLVSAIKQGRAGQAMVGPRHIEDESTLINILPDIFNEIRAKEIEAAMFDPGMLTAAGGRPSY